MLGKFSAKRIIGFALFDWLGTLAILLLASYMRVWLGAIPEFFLGVAQTLDIPIRTLEINLISDTLTTQVFVLVSLIWPFFFFALHVYDGRYNDTLRAELGHVFLAVFASTLTLAGLLYFTYQETSRLLFVLFFGLDMFLLLGARFAFWLLKHSGWRNNTSRHEVLIVGAGPVGQRVAGELKRYGKDRLHVAGFVDDDSAIKDACIETVPVLGTLEQITKIVQERDIHDAVVALPLRAHAQIIDICQTLQNLSIRVHVVPDLFALSFPSATLYGFGGIPVIDLGQPGIYGWRRLLKRAFDVIVASILLLAATPIMLVIAILIKLDSYGPVFYHQRRTGENGQPFFMLKFRSMKVNNDDKIHREYMARIIKENISLSEQAKSSNVTLKLQRDPRITRVGHFIRKTSLDELPQFINVIRGEMSLVGPRPPIPYEVELYEEWHKRRLEAIPGITGMWQVHGRNLVSFDEMVRMDIAYIERQSLWLDLKLLVQTPLALISGRGAG